jgi:putative transcriptional regulator
MPIVVWIDVMLAKRKITLTELSARINISVQNLSNLKCDRTKAINFATLALLCEALRCTPGDILESVEEEEYRRIFRHGD